MAVAMEGSREQPRIEVDGPRCPFCREALRQDEEKVGCPGCMGWQHAACARENRNRCAACSVELPERDAPVPAARRVGALARVLRRLHPPERARAPRASAGPPPNLEWNVAIILALALAGAISLVFALGFDSWLSGVVLAGMGALGFAAFFGHAHERLRLRRRKVADLQDDARPSREPPDKIPPPSGDPS